MLDRRVLRQSGLSELNSQQVQIWFMDRIVLGGDTIAAYPRVDEVWHAEQDRQQLVMVWTQVSSILEILVS